MKDAASSSSRKAPSWLAPLLAVVLVLALMWALGVTVFRGALEDRGLPEEIRGSSNEQLREWEYGAQLKQLDQRSETLAALAKEAKQETAPALQALHDSLSQASALLGELHYEDEQPTELATSYSAEAATSLADEVLQAGQSVPVNEAEDEAGAALLARIAFEVSLDARSVLHAVQEDDARQVPAPLGSTDDAGDAPAQPETGAVACLSDRQLLDQQTALPADTDLVALHAARALDRGYALDYVLQVQAARNGAKQAAIIEQHRQQLAEHLQDLRATVPADCPDLRLAAYDLPGGGLEKLPSLASSLQQEFTTELLLAVGAAEDQTRQVLGDLVWNVTTEQQDAGKPAQLLAPGKQ